MIDKTRYRSGIVRILISGLCSLALNCATTAVAADDQCSRPQGGRIPALFWPFASDWINVKQDVTPAAVGDGESDDTEAINAGLRQLGRRPGDAKVLFLPAGTYKISRTLELKDIYGVMIVGQGRDTRIVWDGAAGERMFVSDGVSRSSYIGLVWDGNGIAGVGIEHAARRTYETHVLHQHMEFKGFTIAGIRVGFHQKIASAEMFFSNLLFRNNQYGVLFEAWNDYNNIFDGVEFLDNQIGIKVEKGNVVVRNARFEGSTETDVYLSTHTHSIRRAVSVRSNRFIDTVSGHSVGIGATIQNCAIYDPASTDGVMVFRGRGPVTIFDTLISGSDSKRSAIVMAAGEGVQQYLLISNVTAPGAKGIVALGSIGEVIDIPKSNREQKSIQRDIHFLRDEVSSPPEFLDVKRDCGARGDGRTDDWRAIQGCIDHARGRGIFVYIPSGIYAVGRTIEVTGGNFGLMGTGWHSQLLWTGRGIGPLLRVGNVKEVALQHLAFGGDNTVTKLAYEPDQASALRLFNVHGWTESQLTDRSFMLSGDSAKADLSADAINGTVTIQGRFGRLLFKSLVGTQMMFVPGLVLNEPAYVLGRVSCCKSIPLTLGGDSNVVMTDWYNEQSEHLIKVAESESDRRGNVVISMTQSQSSERVAVFGQGTLSRLAMWGGMYGQFNEDRPRYWNVGGKDSATEIVLAGGIFKEREPIVDNPKRTIVGNIVQRRGDPTATVKAVYRGEDAMKLRDILDTFRRADHVDYETSQCSKP